MSFHSGSRKAGAMSRDRRGVALLVALGVLVMLALLGAVFATLSGIERSVARNYIDKVRARFLAESGVEMAFGKLSAEHGLSLDIWGATGPMAWIFYGLDANGDGVVNAGESSKYSYTLPSGEVFHDWGRCPLEEAVRPSFPMDRNGSNTFDNGDLLTIDGVPSGVSGMTDVGTYSPTGNVYALKVTDLQSRLNVNNRHTHMATIINNMAKRMSLPATVGDTVIAVRDRQPDRTLTTLDQLIPALPRTTVERLRSVLTVNGWVDEKMIKPIGLTAGKRNRDLNVGEGVYAYRELRPRGIEPIDPVTGLASADYEPRSPVNINTAPFEVLAALMEGLSGFYLQESLNPWPDVSPYDWVGVELSFAGVDQKTSGKVGAIYRTPTLGPKTADNIAHEIMKARLVYPTGTGTGTVPPQSIFRSYQQLGRFFDQLPSSVFDPGEITAPAGIPLDVLHNEIRDLLKANFDPNCHLNELNPDEMLHLKIDKTDLFYWTTEFCFFPMGHFEIESLGRVVDDRQRELASAKVYVHAKLFDVHRDTTQADFQRDFILNDDNTALDLPGSRAAIETRLQKSFSTSGAGAYPVAGHWGAYPEFFMDPQHVRDSSYDGYMSLLNLWAAPRGSTLRARFMPSTDSDPPSASFTAYSSGAGGGVLIPDAGGGPWYDKLVNGAQSGCLMTDGVFSEKDTAPAYPNRGNFNQHVGSLAFWVKPAFEPERAGKIRHFFHAVTYDLSGYSWGGPSNGLKGWPLNGFGLCYLANHDMTKYPENTNPVTYDGGNTHWPTRSVAAGFGGSFNRTTKFWTDQPVDANGNTSMRERVAFNASGTLNHIGHGHDYINYLGDDWGNFLVQGRWMHLGMVWNDSIGDPCKVWLYVNGLRVERTATGQNLTSNYPNTLYGEASTYADPADPSVTVKYLGLPADIPDTARYLNVVGIPPPPLRFGGEAQTPLLSNFIKSQSPTYAASHTRYPNNFPADSTIDEVLTWPGIESPQNVLDMWMEGRFYKSYGTPDKGNTTGSLANFTSARISVQRDASRTAVRPPKGNAPLPGPVTAPTAPSAGASERVQLGLVAFTLRVPHYETMGIKYPSGKLPEPRVFVDILDADTRTSILTGGGGSAILGNVAGSTFQLGGGAITDDATPTGVMVTVDTNKTIRYRLWLDAGLADRLNDPFMASPVIDDVTVTYSRMKPDILAWWVND